MENEYKNMDEISGLEENDKIGINNCLEKLTKHYMGYCWMYREEYDNIDLKKYLDNVKDADNLLINRYPKLVLEWSFDNNKDVDINKMC